ncbi:TPA: hypothetical protein ACJI8J_004577 [Kluyvera georgiana]
MQNVPGAMFISEDESIRVVVTRKDGDNYVQWNDEPEIKITEEYVATLNITQVTYIGNLIKYIDDLLEGN